MHFQVIVIEAQAVELGLFRLEHPLAADQREYHRVVETQFVGIGIEKLNGDVGIYLEKGKKPFPVEDNDRGIHLGEGRFHARPLAQGRYEAEDVPRGCVFPVGADPLGAALELNEALLNDVDLFDILITFNVDVGAGLEEPLAVVAHIITSSRPACSL